ncbi:FAD-dependent monooxygenase [Agromyces archimandritae]|uniref:FAD-dependent monooxygenase n=1 Tax=Agromyces archimandritae TaxID=2781962 RepID=A0A975FKW0_9MICO|nr:FAD-dependent monooxygenase [Agromyces archimandritae]QTX04380.1 FAD-dependent monooxygenase [Agromyces archimandritae]
MTGTEPSTTAPRILVSGGGIAGLALALQLVRAGRAVTVVERAPAPRSGGQAVDLRGASHEVARRMGLLSGIHPRRLDERGIAYVDGRGRITGRLSMEAFDGKGPVAEVEISRGDLNEVLLDELAAAAAARPGLLEHRYGDHLASLAQDDSGVDAVFASGRTERYAVAIGADGVHSATRRLAFAPEAEVSTYLGGYIAFFTMPTPADVQPGWFSMRVVPGAAIGIRPTGDPAVSMALITLRTEHDPALRGDRAAQQALVRRMIAGAGWHAATILETMEGAADFYFDELDRVDLDSPVDGRIGLVGDAASCGSPLSGMGTATALIGAYLLAAELVADPVDPVAALRRYAAALAPFAEAGKVLPGGGIGFMVPANRFAAIASQATMGIMLTRPFLPLMRKMYLAGRPVDPALPA